MKTSELKKLLKDAVKEAIQEELRDILLEAVKSSKQPVNEASTQQVNESYAQPVLAEPRKLSPEERKNMFSGILGEMQNGGVANSSYAGEVKASGPIDPVNGSLPEGSVGLDQIMGLMGNK